MNKRSSKDEKYQKPVKRKSGWTRLKETNRHKLLSSITQDKTQRKLNFESKSNIPSALVNSCNTNVEKSVDLDFGSLSKTKNDGSLQSETISVDIHSYSSTLTPSSNNSVKQNYILEPMSILHLSTSKDEKILEKSFDSINKLTPYINKSDLITTNTHTSNFFTTISYNSTLAEKLYFMSNHPIQPQYSQLPFNAYKIYYRPLSDKDVTKVPRFWISFDRENENLYCSVCMCFSKNTESPFIRGLQVRVKHIYKQLEVHEQSKTHDEAVYAYMQAKKKKDVSSLIDINQRNTRVIQVQERRLFLARIIEGILFIGRQGIAYRSHRGEQSYTLDDKSVNHGNFLELLMCWSKFDPLLEKYVRLAISNSKQRSNNSKGRGSLVTFLSKTTINTIISIISQWIQEEIGKEVKEAKFYSLLIDSSQDVTVTDQLAICVRYVIQTDVKERLIKFILVESSKSIDLYNTIKNTMESIGLSFTNIVSQAYDGAANLSGIHNGLQSLIKNDAPQSIYTHCFSHLLNLTLTQASNSCSEAINLFGLLDRLATFFSQSYKRMGKWKQSIIENSVGSEQMLRLQKIGQTRWWSRDVALNNVFDPLSTPNKEKHRFLTVIKSLLAIAVGKDFDLSAKSEAHSIANNLLKFETILTAFVFQSLFVLSSSASLCLQSKKLNYTQGYKLLHNLKANLIKGMNDFEHIFKKATEFAEFLQSSLEEMDETNKLTWSSKLKQKRNRVMKKMAGELTKDEKPSDEKKLFEIEVYKVVYNNALVTLNNR